MTVKRNPFWETKSIDALSRVEWESLCDGCGICCLEKIEDKDTGEITMTSISCHFLDTVTCRCLVYEDRLFVNHDCILLRVKNIKRFDWLPETCAYRCLTEGRELEWWHPLVSGDPNTVHQAGISIRDRALSGRYVHPKDFERYLEHKRAKR